MAEARYAVSKEEMKQRRESKLCFKYRKSVLQNWHRAVTWPEQPRAVAGATMYLEHFYNYSIPFFLNFRSLFLGLPIVQVLCIAIAAPTCLDWLSPWHYLWFRNSRIKLKKQYTLPRLIFNIATKTYKSKKATSGKQISRHSLDYISFVLCL